MAVLAETLFLRFWWPNMAIPYRNVPRKVTAPKFFAEPRIYERETSTLVYRFVRGWPQCSHFSKKGEMCISTTLGNI